MLNSIAQKQCIRSQITMTFEQKERIILFSFSNLCPFVLFAACLYTSCPSCLAVLHKLHVFDFNTLILNLNCAFIESDRYDVCDANTENKVCRCYATQVADPVLSN
eukprot:716878_1